MHKIFFYNKFIIRLYMFRALYALHQEVKIVSYSIWCHHTCRWPSGVQVERGLVRSQPVHRTATYRCNDTRCCIIHLLGFTNICTFIVIKILHKQSLM